MKITLEQLKKIYPHSTQANREKYLPYINEYLEKYKMNTYNIVCAFLAQVGHESGQLKYNEEIASGEAYEGRKNLGNTQPGDGKRYKGRGLIQVTGRANYTLCAKELNIDCVNRPEILKEPRYAVLSAFWFWNRNNLNQYCTGIEVDFKTLTKRINGGLNGYTDRYNIWERTKGVLKSQKHLL